MKPKSVRRRKDEIEAPFIAREEWIAAGFASLIDLAGSDEKTEQFARLMFFSGAAQALAALCDQVKRGVPPSDAIEIMRNEISVVLLS